MHFERCKFTGIMVFIVQMWVWSWFWLRQRICFNHRLDKISALGAVSFSPPVHANCSGTLMAHLLLTLYPTVIKGEKWNSQSCFGSHITLKSHGCQTNLGMRRRNKVFFPPDEAWDGVKPMRKYLSPSSLKLWLLLLARPGNGSSSLFQTFPIEK